MTHIDRSGADESLGDLERLLAVIGLRDQKFVGIDAELLGVDRIERVFRHRRTRPGRPPFAPRR